MAALLGSMNRQMNLPALQRIAMEFEKENDIMDQRQEMMDDAIDDVTGLEDEEEGEEVVQQVLDEIGIDLGAAVSAHVPPKVHTVLTMHPAWRDTIRSAEDCRGRRPGCSGGRRRRHRRRRRPAGATGQPAKVRRCMRSFVVRRRRRRRYGVGGSADFWVTSGSLPETAMYLCPR